MKILGINAYHGDVAAALVVNGELIAAVEEERFRRVKHWAGFPTEAIRSCLEAGGLRGADLDHVAISRDPRAHLWRKVLYTLRRRPSPRLVLDRIQNQRVVGALDTQLAAALRVERRHLPPVHRIEHHKAHLASAFFVSPFMDASLIAIDGFGDFVSTSYGSGQGKQMEVFDRVFFPHSLGMLYTAITQHLGFLSYGDEFKVMGLAPYGKPEFLDPLRSLVTLKEGGKFELELKYFRHWKEHFRMEWTDGYPSMDRIHSAALDDLLGPARRPDEPITSRHESIARSLQAVYEEAAFHVLNGLFERTGNRNLVMAGGCAMNSVANGKIRANTPFQNLYIQPAAGDNGTALGAAYHVWNQILGGERGFVMRHGYWGPAHESDRVLDRLQAERHSGTDLIWEREPDAEVLCRKTAALIAEGNVVGWYQGRMEWGARALGHRSIVADPRRADMRHLINTKIKFREKFRPFAPSILVESVDDYFVDAVPDPFMIQVYPVRMEKRNVIPAVTHVDGSGRLQTVAREESPLYWRLIKAFEELTGVPVLLNTSFNENEPIVNLPDEALDCFLRTRMDVLVLNDMIVRRMPADEPTAAMRAGAVSGHAE